jgi:hypothetical protein
LVFEKNANFFRRKLSKIAESFDHNIDPWQPRFPESERPAAAFLPVASPR